MSQSPILLVLPLGNSSVPACTLRDSLLKPLWSAHANTINPCFLGAVTYLAFVAVGALLLYQLLSLLFNNRHGPFKIKYSFGNPLSVRSVGVLHLFRVQAAAVQAIVLFGLARVSGVPLSLVVVQGLLVLAAVTLFLVLPLHFVETTRSVVGLASLLVFWLVSFLFLTVFALVDFFSSKKVFVPSGDEAAVSVALTCEVFAAVNALVVLVLENSFYYPSQELVEYWDLNGWDINSVNNFLLVLTFRWMNPLLNKVYQTDTVDIKDVPSLLVDLKVENMVPRFTDQWAIESKKTAQKNDKIKLSHKVDPENPSEPKITYPSLFLTLFKIHWLRIVAAIGFEIIDMACTTLLPFLLQKFIVFFTMYSETKNTKQAPPFIVGVSWAVAIYLTLVLRYITFNQSLLTFMKTEFAVESLLSSVSYEKALKLSPEARREKNTGEIVNHVSVDVRDIAGVLEVVSDIITVPLRFALCLFALYNLLGNPTWAGLLVSVVMVPLSSMVSVAFYTLYNTQMEYKDERTRLTSEILNSMKSIKLYSWEKPMMKRLGEIRNTKELKTTKEIGIYHAGATFLWNCIPFFVSCAVYGVFGYFRKTPLTPAIVFPSLSLFDLLAEPLLRFPSILSQVAECKVSLDRLEKFFSLDEMDEDIVNRSFKPLKRNDESVQIKNASFVWSSKEAHQSNQDDVTYALKNIDFTARKGQLSCVVGRVGAGKTTLLRSIVGEIPLIKKDDTSINVNGTIAYCAQNAWILNLTVRENILFGKRYDKDFYEKTVQACQLGHDFEVLPDGDSTLVGEKGISLSGGQKARISLARAVYSRADIYLLDDVLSAVDAHVGQRIIKSVLSKEGLLASKTIILATNAVPVLRLADEIVFIQKGELVERGVYKDLTKNGGLVAQMVAEHAGDKDEEPEQTQSEEQSVDSNEPRPFQPTEAVREDMEDGFDPGAPLAKIATYQSVGQISAVSFDHEYEFEDDFGKARREEEKKEKSEQGRVKLSVFVDFLKACRWPIVLLFVVLYWGIAGLSIWGRVVLKSWSERNLFAGHNVKPFYYLSLYVSSGVISGIVTFLGNYVVWSYSAFYASRYFHDTMANAVLRLPMSFFDTTPIGRIMNRFSNDVSMIDNMALWLLIAFFELVMETLIRVGIVVYNLPFMSVVILFLLLLYIYFRNRYIPGLRELSRLRSTLKSPVLSHLQESVNGLETVRAYNENSRFTHANRKKLNLLMQVNWAAACTHRWLLMRLQLIATFIVLTASMLVLGSLFTKKNFSPGMVGFLMTYVFSSTAYLNAIIRYWSELETKFVSVERIIEYCKLKPEAPEIIPENRPKDNWPSSGAITFENYSTRYREGLEPVLKDINLDVKPLEKIGIVGRTGAGKSSLTLALFRIIEATEGNISIDAVDTSKIGLFDLRSHLNIIPQDAHAFEGTVRENLDPFEQYSDERLWKVLEMAHLKEHVENMKTEVKEDSGRRTKKVKKVDTEPQVGLRAQVLEGGSNLSSGQKQLLCLARALLKDSRVLVLDEATAAVDVQTDKIIQETIRSEFKDKTILTIAHRLETIMDSDRVIVLDKGRVAEFDTVPALLANKEGIFYSLCKEGGFLDKK